MKRVSVSLTDLLGYTLAQTSRTNIFCSPMITLGYRAARDKFMFVVLTMEYRCIEHFVSVHQATQAVFNSTLL